MLLRGVLLFEEGDLESGLETLHEAFNWETSTDPSKDGPPMPIIPSFELYAKYLLKAGRPSEALAVLTSGNYTSSRNRGATLFLFAQASEALGLTKDACTHYARLLEEFAVIDVHIAEIDQVTAFLEANCEVPSTARVAKAGFNSGLPRSLKDVNTAVEGPKKREQLMNRVWDWATQTSMSSHC